MGLLQTGRVAVTTGSNAVRGVHSITVSAVVGEFLNTEDCFWGVDGVGKIVEHDTVLNLLRFYRVSGAAPAVGNVITNPGATKSATISTFRSDTAPRFDLLLAGLIPTRFWLPEDGVVYGITTTPVGADYFSLSALFGESTRDDNDYAVLRDFTPYFGWPLAMPGDIHHATIDSEQALAIESTIRPQPAIDAGLIPSWQLATGGDAQYVKDADGVVHVWGAVRKPSGALPSTILHLPAGFRSARYRRFVCATAVGVAIVELTPLTGELICISGTVDTYLHLDGIQFRAEA